MGIIKDAKDGTLRKEIGQISKDENLSIETVMDEIANGRMVVPYNKNNPDLKIKGMGHLAYRKTFIAIGSNPSFENNDLELEKAKTAVKYGVDSISDLSSGPNLVELRRNLLKEINIPVASTPIYETAAIARKRDGACAYMKRKDFINAFENTLMDGSSMVRIEPGITNELLNDFKDNDRIMGLTHRSSLLMAGYIMENDAENPYYENFDKILKIAAEYDIVLGLTHSFGAISIIDSADRFYNDELLILTDLIERARDAEVQVSLALQSNFSVKKLINTLNITRYLLQVPISSSGTQVTNIAPGYDNITSAIGEAISGDLGADLLGCSAASEALFTPTTEDVREATITARLAAHIADLNRNNPDAWKLEKKMIRARSNDRLEDQINAAIDPEKADLVAKIAPATNPLECGECNDGCPAKEIMTRYRHPI